MLEMEVGDFRERILKVITKLKQKSLCVSPELPNTHT